MRSFFYFLCIFQKRCQSLFFNNRIKRLRDFKFVTTLVLVLEKVESKDKTEYDNFYSSSKAETITNESDVDN